MKDALQKLIPFSGEVNDPDDNPHLERFRKAANCYYDLYNNGLCNMGREFECVFGFLPDGADNCVELTTEIVNKTERALDRIILAAAKEQGIRSPQ